MSLTDVAILLVEDDRIFSQVVTEYLSKHGANVQQAFDGQQGLQLFSTTRFDIVIAELNVPKLNGLTMLKKMVELNPAVPSIVLSRNEVMSDVVEALRIGASDYLVKPVDDLMIIEQAIFQAMISAAKPADVSDLEYVEEFNELSYQELNDNLFLLEQSTEAAKSVQQQLFPSSSIEYPKASINYSLFKNSDISAYFIDSTMVGEHYLVMYMAHFKPEDHSAAFGCVLLRSFINQKLKLFRNELSQTLIEPFNMLSYLNDRLVRSGLHIQCDIVYVCADITSYSLSIAQSGNGLRSYIRNTNGLTPLALAESKPIGSANWTIPSLQFRVLAPGEALCIGTPNSHHKDLLMKNHFKGLVYQTDIQAGGFMELSFD